MPVENLEIVKIPSFSTCSRFLVCLLVAWVIAAAPTVRADAATDAAAGPEPLRFAVFPFGSPEFVTNMFQPTIAHLEAGQERRVELVVPADEIELIEMGLDRGFTVGIVPPHFAGLLMSERGYVPVATIGGPTRPTFYVWQASGIERLTDLRGKRVIVPGRAMLARIRGEAELRRAGLQPGKDFSLLTARNHFDAIYRMLDGEADALVSFPGTVRQMAPNVAGELRVLYEGDPTPNVMVILAPSLSATTQEQLASLFLASPPPVSVKARASSEAQEGAIADARAVSLTFRAINRQELEALDGLRGELLPVLRKIGVATDEAAAPEVAR